MGQTIQSLTEWWVVLGGEDDESRQLALQEVTYVYCKLLAIQY